jgi:hypothetical protein
LRDVLEGRQARNPGESETDATPRMPLQDHGAPTP